MWHTSFLSTFCRIPHSKGPSAVTGTHTQEGLSRPPQQVSFGCPGPGRTAWRCPLHSGGRRGSRLGFLGKKLAELRFGSGMGPPVGTSTWPWELCVLWGGGTWKRASGMPSDAWRARAGSFCPVLRMAMGMGGGPGGATWRWECDLEEGSGGTGGCLVTHVVLRELWARQPHRRVGPDLTLAGGGH